MSKIARVHDKAEMRKAWEGTFKSNEHFTMVFQPEIECCLLYPHTGASYVPDYLYRAVTEAARAAGDRGFYVSETESEGNVFFDYPNHWWCEFPPHDDYYPLLPNMVDNAMYAGDSSWGVAMSHDWHALVGGPEDFIRYIDESCPEWRQDVIRTIDRWDYTIKTRGSMIINLIVGSLDYWNKYPADEWVTTVAANVEHQLQEFWKSRPDPVGVEWAVWLAEKMDLKLEE